MATDTSLPQLPSVANRRPWLRALTTIATLAFGAGLIWMAARGLDLDELQTGIAEMRWWPVVVAAVVLMGVPIALASQWRIIVRGGGERRLGYDVLLPMAAFTLFWQNVCHFMLGYGWALHRFVHREKLRPAEALGVVSIDQLGEAFAKMIFSGTLVFYMLSPDRAATLLPVCYVLAPLVYFTWRPVLRRVVAWLARREERSPTGRKRLVSGAMIRPYVAMWNERSLWSCVGLALTKKLLRVAATALALVALGLDLPWIAPFVFIAVLEVATLVPLIPGHMGVYEATAAATFVRFGASPESSLLIGVLYHAAFLVAAILPAALVVAVRTVREATEAERLVEAELEQLLPAEEPIEPSAEGMAA